MTRWLGRFSLYCVFSFLAIPSLHAGVLVDVIEIGGSGLGNQNLDSFFLQQQITPNSNNDNDSSVSTQDLVNAIENAEQTPNFNGVLVTKIFEELGPIDIVFAVQNSDTVITNAGGVTEYHFLELVFNGTGETWRDYHIELGYGVGDNFIPLDDLQRQRVRAGEGGPEGLDLDTPDKDPAPGSFHGDLVLPQPGGEPISFFEDVTIGDPLFTELTHQEHQLWWLGGELPSLQSNTNPQAGDSIPFGFFTFSLDVPDFGPISLTNEGGPRPHDWSFTLRQVPTTTGGPQKARAPGAVPEPSTMILTGIGLGFAAFRKKFQKS